jgi:hypothetical protein
MYRSDRIYLSKFELDPDPEYLDLDDFDFDYGEYDDAFYEEIIPGHEKKLAQETKRPISRPIKIEGQGI